MSEVQRYTYEVDDGVFAECVLGEDYDAAQSELAALREELAEYQKILASYKNNYVTNLAYNAVQSSLTAAEQRNAELVVMLRQAWIDECVSAEDCRKIDAALKPTESGASE